ncbi:hypothetical protein KIPB_010938 [Kipferlia bialata]|uniref:Uncharacterized protein n=1 Tax=Kipferlia bialata TaxID=797122 RepID=A0A9K3D5S7_9EUKA|nr:hypothetical protein KIPB_010938 [Kipferlia bialata]|eukprot:g10938.t1
MHILTLVEHLSVQRLIDTCVNINPATGRTHIPEHQKQYLIRSAQSVSTDMIEKGEKLLERSRDRVRDLDSMALIIDLWACSYNRTDYLALLCPTETEDLFLGFIEHTKTHTGDNIRASLEDLLYNKIKIKREAKLYVTCDRGSGETKCLEDMANTDHIKCGCHLWHSTARDVFGKSEGKKAKKRARGFGNDMTEKDWKLLKRVQRLFALISAINAAASHKRVKLKADLELLIKECEELCMDEDEIPSANADVPTIDQTTRWNGPRNVWGTFSPFQENPSYLLLQDMCKNGNSEARRNLKFPVSGDKDSLMCKAVSKHLEHIHGAFLSKLEMARTNLVEGMYILDQLLKYLKKASLNKKDEAHGVMRLLYLNLKHRIDNEMLTVDVMKWT